MNKIKEALLKRFEDHRVIFWYDEKEEFFEQYSEIDIPSINKIQVQDNEFEVKHIVNKYQNIGYKSVQWDTKNSKGQSVPTGVYIYRISAGKFTNMKKMVILR